MRETLLKEKVDVALASFLVSRGNFWYVCAICTATQGGSLGRHGSLIEWLSSNLKDVGSLLNPYDHGGVSLSNTLNPNLLPV